ncbi:MAG: creatininase family protein [Wenzhouxiangella sp.]
MLLKLATWPEIEAYLEHSRAIVIPVGSTEQHGPTGLLGTDAICPETIAGGMAEAGILVAPTLSIGMAQHHLGFPGSISLRPTTLISVVRDVVASLAVSGFTHFYFLNGHGGNIAPFSAAFAEIWADASLAGRESGLRMKLGNWFAGPRVAALARKRYGDGEGSHATPAEIALTWHAYPEAERRDALDPVRAPNGPIRDATDYRRHFPDGRIGSEPHLASAEDGREFYQAGLADAMEDFRQFAQSVDKTRE